MQAPSGEKKKKSKKVAEDGAELIDGATIIARALKQQGVELMFGIVGIPVVPIAIAAQAEGIRFLGFRNEQSAAYAAGIVGYMTGRPAACLGVSGPGMVHLIAGMANAWSNNWPVIFLGGANDSFQDGMQAFQETPQIEAARPFCKYAARPDQVARLPFFIEQAVRTSIYGRPGAVYLDLPGNIITGKVSVNDVTFPSRCPDPPRTLADPNSVAAAVKLLKEASNPLIIVGKGAAYARAEKGVRELVESTNIPYLATPMGKGVIPDDHPQSIAAARSQALQHADVILLIGARLNWILHFGLPPRFSPNVKFIQLDISPEELHHNVRAAVTLCGDAVSIVDQLNTAVRAAPFAHPGSSPWWDLLRKSIEKNRRLTEPMMASSEIPMGYYRVLREIRDQLPRDAIVVSEGSNTMDISRSVINNFLPRSRLDAGSYGTMGVGLGFAIAAACAEPQRKVVAIEGDSAFGFSGMEIETAARYHLPITVIILNNNGIYSGFPELDPDSDPLPNCLTPNSRYELLATAFGGKGYNVSTPDDLRAALADALAQKVPTVINVNIDTAAVRKPQDFAWLTQDSKL